MAHFHNNALIGSGGLGGDTEYLINRSLRFNTADSAYLNRTPSSAGNRKTWTWSGWVKRSTVDGSFMSVFGAGGGTTRDRIQFFNDQKLVVNFNDGNDGILKTSQVFRDPSAWQHIIVALDTTQATASNRLKIYVNGSQVEDFDTETYPSQNYQTRLNNNIATYIGQSSSDNFYFDGYLADVHFIDGQALSPSSFGETNSYGVWDPKKFSGSFGTNGFHLKFADNSSNAALGTDSSGNSNTFTVNNLTAVGVEANTSQTWSSSQTNYHNSNAADAFDGDFNTSGFATGGANSNAYVDITAINASKVEVYISAYGSGSAGGYWYARQTNGTEHRYTITSSGTSLGWVTVYDGSQIQINRLGGARDAQGDAGSAQRAWRVDGLILVNSGTSGFGLEATDSLIDTPTNYEADSGNNGGNYATLNPLAPADGTISDGNLQIVTNTSGYGVYTSNFRMSSGKWYAEAVATAMPEYTHFGLIKSSVNYSSSTIVGNVTDTAAYRSNDGIFRLGNSNKFTGATFAAGDVIGLGFDADAGSCAVYKNGALQGTATGFSSGAWFFAGSDNGSGIATHVWNFGQRPFKYTNAGTDRPAATFLSLCTQNLPDPTIADGSTAFDIDLYTGTNASLERSNFAFSPDLLWFKSRNAARTHVLIDTVRGRAKALESQSNGAEYTSDANRDLVSFDSDGFTVGQTQHFSSVNRSGDSIVVWAWDAGTSTASNTDGSVTSNVRASQANGCSVVTWTGSSAGQTVGHGLGASPELIIVKARDQSQPWAVYHSALGRGGVLQLHSTAANITTYSNYWGTAEPSSTVFGTYTGQYPWANNYGNMVAYCFAPVEGFSAFGSYTGNGSSDGPFVHTGMRPKWILLKRSDGGSENWTLWDTERNTFNVMGKQLYPNLSNAEADAGTNSSYGILDSVSNGFKLRGSHTSFNLSGGTFIYAAFAEHPFKTARAR